MVIKIDLKKVALWISLAAIELMVIIIAQYGGDSVSPVPKAALMMNQAAYNVVVSAVDQVTRDIDSGGVANIDDARSALSFNLGGPANEYTDPILTIVDHPSSIDEFKEAMAVMVKRIKVTE